MKLEQLRKKYFDLLDEAKALVTKAETEKRNLDVNETNDYDTKINEAETIKKQIRAMEKANELEEDEVRHVDHAEPKKSPWNSFGEFLRSVQRAGTIREIDPRLETRASGMNESVPSEGGFLVPAQHVPELLKKTYAQTELAKMTRSIQLTGNSMTINRVDETSRVTGSRWGGVQAYWLNEGGTKTASKPAFGRMQLTLKKLIGMCYATDELLDDAVALESVINEAFPAEFAWMIDDALVNGTGAGQPLGIMSSPCLITVPKEGGQPADTILYNNIVKMWARMWAKSRPNAVWLINQDIEPQLNTVSMPVGVGGVPVFLPATGAAGMPYATLFGRPILPVEYCQTLGTKGDIILADFSQYLMVDKAGIKKDTSIHVKFDTDETAFRFVYRCDGQPMWPAAVTPAKGTNTLSPFVALADR
jgi:HK97 family phage major capsid protein